VERTEAARLYRILQEVRLRCSPGGGDFSKLEGEALAKFNEKWAADYVRSGGSPTCNRRHPRTATSLSSAPQAREARLIDNVEVSL